MAISPIYMSLRNKLPAMKLNTYFLNPDRSGELLIFVGNRRAESPRRGVSSEITQKTIVLLLERRLIDGSLHQRAQKR